MDGQDLGVSLGRVRRGRVDRQVAKEAPERLVLVMAEFLVAEEDDDVVHQRVVHLLELLIAERTRQVDPADFRPDMRRQLSDLDRLIGHRAFLLSASPAGGRLAHNSDSGEGEAMEQIGVLETICRYPVKSMAGEEIAEAFIGYGGVLGDRVYGFIRAGGMRGFPWHTARE